MCDACWVWDHAMVDGDRGKWRCTTTSADVKMNNLVVRFLTSTRSASVIRILMLLFIVWYLVSAALSQPSGQHPDRQQAEDATNPRFLSALDAYKAERYAAAEHELEPLVKS